MEKLKKFKLPTIYEEKEEEEEIKNMNNINYIRNSISLKNIFENHKIFNNNNNFKLIKKLKKTKLPTIYEEE